MRCVARACHDAHMTDWAALTDAYGRADGVPTLLVAAGLDDPAAWEELWGRLCHQGTVSTASYAAIPHLAVLALQSEPSGYNQALALSAAIVGSEDGPETSEAIRYRYASYVREMRTAAERNLPFARDDVEFVYGVQALLALEGVPTWKNHLESIADGEVGLECPACHEFLLLALEGATGQEGSKEEDPNMQATGIPAGPNRLDPGADRAYSIAIAHQRPNVAAAMLRLFGRAHCPLCGDDFDVASAL